MPYFIVYRGRDGKTINNIVISNHPLEWYANAIKTISDDGSNDKIILLWWEEISKDQAELFDPGYRKITDKEYDPIFPGSNY